MGSGMAASTRPGLWWRENPKTVCDDEDWLHAGVALAHPPVLSSIQIVQDGCAGKGLEARKAVRRHETQGAGETAVYWPQWGQWMDTSMGEDYTQTHLTNHATVRDSELRYRKMPR